MTTVDAATIGIGDDGVRRIGLDLPTVELVDPYLHEHAPRLIIPPF